MIAKKSGAIYLGDLHLHPCMTEDEFLRGEAGLRSQPSTSNPPWQSYTVRTNDGKFGFLLSFKSKRLAEVSFGTYVGSWDGWSKDKESTRKQDHDELLSSWLGEPSPIPPQYRFSWGEIFSGFGTHDPTAHITIRYSAAK